MYKTKTTITDFGPYITGLMVNAGKNIGVEDVASEDFLVFVERKNKATREILWTKEFFLWDKEAEPAVGYRKVLNTYPCDEEGNYVNHGTWVMLELGCDALGKVLDGTSFSENDYKITYIKAEGIFENGRSFTQYRGDICPQLEGWANGESHDKEMPLKYGYYTPKILEAASGELKALPLIVWLHGAGEGGSEPTVAYIGNKAVNFSASAIQEKFGGGAWVLVPQCPTVWMDDGVEQLGHSNQSIYTVGLKACIDEFIKKHSKLVDPSRIYLGGCSNGGFMTVRMAMDYPGFFAAIFPVCEAFFEENLTPDKIDKLKDTPCWLVHAKGDGLVDPKITALPLYKKLKQSGAENIHFTFFDTMDDVAADFFKDVKLPPHVFDHGVWVHVYNDQCRTDFDGSPVYMDGQPVSLLEWLSSQSLGNDIIEDFAV